MYATEGNLLPKADVTLDTLGLFCPIPIINASKTIRELTVGEVLEVLSSDEGIKKDMPAWCETTGHELVAIEHDTINDKPAYRAFVRKRK